MARLASSVALLLLLAACGDEVLLHRLDEPQANEVLLALADAGVVARRTPPEGEEGGVAIAVRPAEAAHARGVLSARDLPRSRAPGFSELFGSPGLVPTPLEEHARYLHALSGELSRTLEGIDGVVSARVHVALPAPDPLRPDGRRAPRASVLVKCRPEARPRLDGEADALRRLVAGAADGLDPASVAVVLTEGPPPPSRAAARSRSRGWLAGAALALALALAGGAVAVGRRRGGRR
jgi:type III secretion protein J